MAQIFISYSRVDRTFTEVLAQRLRRIYGYDAVWYDESLHGGDIWWEEILDQVAACDIFLYLLSNESVTSPYCQAEFEEAQRLQKRIITVQARDHTRLTKELGDIHYVDMKDGPDDADAYNHLLASINKQMTKVKKRARPLWKGRTPRPEVPEPEPEPARPLDVTTPDLRRPAAWGTGRGNGFGSLATIIAAIIMAAATIVAALIMVGGDDGGNVTDTPTPTTEQVAQMTEVEQTVQAEMAAIQLENAQTDAARQTATAGALAVQTQGTADALTAVATLWTPTPTPDARQTAEARLTQTQAAIDTHATANAVATLNANHTATRQALDQTATATLWTDTPAPTNTPSHTPTPIPAGYPGGDPTTANDQWIPVIQDFDGVEMVLVPAECFLMGSDDGSDDEQPVHEQCFDEPFWIDRYEVSQGQLVQFGFENDSYFDGDALPAETITWFEARDFCALRGARLPTEAEWEYAARGPDSLIYPWGNTFVGDNVVYSGNSNSQTANVGSREGGISWVGAYDLSGNVWEWVSSWYVAYPYSRDDGRENDSGYTYRVLRGGSFYVAEIDLRAALRFGDYPVVGFGSLGFRCARSYAP